MSRSETSVFATCSSAVRAIRRPQVMHRRGLALYALSDARDRLAGAQINRKDKRWATS
jgi:hypothetical protein